jgi:hypothetical protein
VGGVGRLDGGAWDIARHAPPIIPIKIAMFWRRNNLTLLRISPHVIPAKAGIHSLSCLKMDPRLRKGDDGDFCF